MIDQLTRRPQISTARLELRAPTPADARAIAALANDYEVVKHTGGMPYPYGHADGEAFIARATAADPEREVHFVIDLPGEGAIGGIGFYPGAASGPEVGYWLGRPYWGRGFATEALKGVMAWAARDWGRRSAVASHHVDNPASAVVLVKAGFLYTGVVEPRPCRARGHDVMCRWMVWLA